MLRFGLLSLICCVSFGVFGFGGSHAANWVGGQVLSLVCLACSAVGFLAGVWLKPTGLRSERFNDGPRYASEAKGIRCT